MTTHPSGIFSQPHPCYHVHFLKRLCHLLCHQVRLSLSQFYAWWRGIVSICNFCEFKPSFAKSEDHLIIIEPLVLSQLPTSYVMKSVSISNAFRKFLDSLSVCLLHNNFDKSLNSSFKVVLTEISFPKRLFKKWFNLLLGDTHENLFSRFQTNPY